MEYPQVYKLSPAEARARGETSLFRESKKMNVACKAAIEAAIRENFDGMHLKKECIRPVMEEYGTDRDMPPLAAWNMKTEGGKRIGISAGL